MTALSLSDARRGAQAYQPETREQLACWYKKDENGEVWCSLATDSGSGAWTHMGGRRDYPFGALHLPCWVPEQGLAGPAAWTGEGLPPVGAVCEAYDYNDGKWVVGKMLMHGNSDHAFATGTPECWGTLFWACEFRPIRTPEQIAAEEREKAVSEMAAIAQVATGLIVNRADFEALYDAGYRKLEGGAA